MGAAVRLAIESWWRSIADRWSWRRHKQLIRIWEASSDYLLARRDPQFAAEHGGVEGLREELQKAVNEFEE